MLGFFPLNELARGELSPIFFLDGTHKWDFNQYLKNLFQRKALVASDFQIQVTGKRFSNYQKNQ
jgi:hypothetical protein